MLSAPRLGGLSHQAERLQLVQRLASVYLAPVSSLGDFRSLLVGGLPVYLLELCKPLLSHFLYERISTAHLREPLQRLPSAVEGELLFSEVAHKRFNGQFEVIGLGCQPLPVNVGPVDLSPFDLVDLRIEVVPPTIETKLLPENAVDGLLGRPARGERPRAAFSQLVPIITVLEAEIAVV